jgi:hypothetical protein
MATPTTLPAAFTAGQVLTAAQLNDLRGAFRVLQTVSTTKTDTFSTASTTYVDVTGLSVSITPSATSSQVLVFAQVNYGYSGDINNYVQLVRGSTAIDIGAVSGSSSLASLNGTMFGGTWLNLLITPGTLVFLDSPATTSATTYKIQQRVNQGTGYVNRSGRDNGSTDARTASTITVMEISA